MRKVLFALLAFVCVTAAGQTVIPAENLREHVFILASDSLSGRGFGFPEKAMAVDYIRSQFICAGFRPVDEDYIHVFNHKQGLFFTEGKNIIGIVEGSDPVLKDEYIVLGAHYDHMGWEEKDGEKVVYNGADDNASGIATIIEVGKALKRAGVKRSVIIVAFDGEEAGLLGSKAFVADDIIDLSKVKVMFSLDMVGMLETNGGLNLDGINMMEGGRDIAEQIAGSDGISLAQTKNTIEARTDTWPFGAKRIPAVHVFTGLKSPYHKPADDADLLDYEGMSSVAGYMTDLVTDLADRETIVTDNHLIRRATDPRFLAGVEISYGASSHSYRNVWFKNKAVFAVEVGLVSKIKLNRFFSLQPGVCYQTFGSRTEGGRLRMHSVSPALDLLLTTPANDISSPVSYLRLGGFYRHNFAGYLDGDSFDPGVQYPAEEKGLRAGFGFGYSKFQINYMFEYGLDKINLTDTYGNGYPRAFYVSVVRFF